MTIYDFSGNKVIDQECGHGLDPNYITCSWNGKNSSNLKVSNGVYFCKMLTTDGKEYWEKLGVINLK